MITANIIHRIFRIKCANSVGTAFTIDYEGKEYLITARHVVEDFSLSNGLEVFANGDWISLSTTLVAHGADDIDVSVFASNDVITPQHLPIIASSDGLTYGQDVYFLGFPYGVLSEVIFSSSGYHLPLVKKALLSSFAGNIYLLDGHNNPGFSGGPVVFGKGGGTPTCIGAIISGYRFEPEPVFLGDDETSLTFRANTGIIISYKIELAIDLIRNNPVG